MPKTHGTTLTERLATQSARNMLGEGGLFLRLYFVRADENKCTCMNDLVHLYADVVSIRGDLVRRVFETAQNLTAFK